MNYSHLGKGGISSSTVTRMYMLDTELRKKYSTTCYCSSTSALHSREAHNMPWMVALVTRKRLMDLK